MIETDYQISKRNETWAVPNEWFYKDVCGWTMGILVFAFLWTYFKAITEGWSCT